MENLKQKLKDEGFKNVYEWTDEPGTEYPEHKHVGKVAFYVLKGSITMHLEGRGILVSEGERFDVPVGVSHSGIVGLEGCTYIIGEEVEGDS